MWSCCLSIHLSFCKLPWHSFNLLDTSAHIGKEIGTPKVLDIYNNYKYLYISIKFCENQWLSPQVTVSFWQKSLSGWPGSVCVRSAQVTQELSDQPQPMEPSASPAVRGLCWGCERLRECCSVGFRHGRRGQDIMGATERHRGRAGGILISLILEFYCYRSVAGGRRNSETDDSGNWETTQTLTIQVSVISLLMGQLLFAWRRSLIWFIASLQSAWPKLETWNLLAVVLTQSSAGFLAVGLRAAFALQGAGLVLWDPHHHSDTSGRVLFEIS